MFGDGEPIQLHNKSLSRQVYEVLETEIIAGRIAPGTRLGEEVIAARLGVSRSPVREAIADLERIGFAERVGKRDRRVSVPDERFIAETYAVLIIIETGHAHLASLMATSETYRACHRILAELKEALDGGERERYARLTAELHEAMKAPLDNRQMRKVIADHRKYVTWLEALYNPEVEDFSTETLDEHRLIFEFYIKRDFIGLVNSLGAHIERHKARMLKQWHVSIGAAVAAGTGLATGTGMD